MLSLSFDNTSVYPTLPDFATFDHDLLHETGHGKPGRRARD